MEDCLYTGIEMEDKLIIKDIEFIGHCGITEEERMVGQRISADIEIFMDIAKAASSDRIEDTIDYVEICKRIISIGRKEKFHLLETLANRISEEILKRFGAQEVRLILRKCSVPVEEIKGYFAVEVTRRRE